MTIENENSSLPQPVEVTLPDEETKVTEIALEDKSAKIDEPSPTVREISDKKDKEEEPQVDAREKALSDLRKQYEYQKRVAEAERDARRQAEYYARQQAHVVGRAQNEVQDSNLRIIMNAIDATEQAAAVAERDYSEAMAIGDYQLAAKAQRAIAQAESHLLQLNNGRSKLEEMLQQPAEGAVYEPQVPSFEPQIPQDPIEMYAERLTPKSAQWLREHPDAANKIGKLTRAHQDAMEDGIVPESNEYFNYIEARMGYSGRNMIEEEAPRHREVPRKTLASAPVTSSASSTMTRSTSSPNTMVLSPSEVEMAILAEPELPRDRAIEAYARNKAFLIKQGKLSA